MESTIIIAILSSGALAALISGLFATYNKKQDRKYLLEDKADEEKQWKASVDKKLQKAEMDNVRLQMLVLMADYPQEEAELMRVAEHYFTEGGNWYMTSMFNKWIKNNNIAEPDWFKAKKNENT